MEVAMKQLLIISLIGFLYMSTTLAGTPSVCNQGEGYALVVCQSQNNEVTKKMEELPYVEGDFVEIINTGPGVLAIHCEPNRESACFEYNKYQKWVRLCDGVGTMISYVETVVYVGLQYDPETGKSIDIYNVTISTD
jgi:hypothetical protein